MHEDDDYPYDEFTLTLELGNDATVGRFTTI